ncbi:MAG TPA: hypothetical protein VMI33_10430 [Streptosporangiaceae bacterium]|nr:hypothetical protein [Streptosporangiaceae bacterium]
MSHHEPQMIAMQGKEADRRQPPKDPFLAVLVKAVNGAPGWEFGVTLHVNGLIISGLLCSMTSFFEEQAELFRQLGSAETAEARQGFAEVFDALAEQSQSQPGIEHANGDQAVASDAPETDLPSFIHLRAATVHAPGTDAVLPETLWRGRLDHVSGWSIGNFGPKPPPRSRATA